MTDGAERQRWVVKTAGVTQGPERWKWATGSVRNYLRTLIPRGLPLGPF